MTRGVKNSLNMRSDFKHSASVEQFLHGDMSQAERENFEQTVLANPELAYEVGLSRMIDEALLKDDILDVRKKLLDAFLEKGKKKNKVPLLSLIVKNYWYAAASLFLIVGLGITLYYSVPLGKSNDSLFRQYYSANDLIDVTRAGDATIVEAAMKFQERNYSLSSQLFKSILEDDQNNMACWFYYGISNIETGNLAEAEKAFSMIIKDNQSLYVEQAEWYLALNHIKRNQSEKAIVLLYTISANPESKHQKDAARLLEKLK